MTRAYLVIDDNRDFAENLAEILRDSGADVEIALDGPEAIRLVRARRFDALVTDMRMPGMSGTEVLQEVRRIDPGVPVVLLSAYSHDSELREARRSGLLAVLSKPNQVPRLLDLLAHARRDATIVLVEDDPALADNLSEALQARGLSVCAAGDLAELEAIGVKPFLALVDLKLPGAKVGESLDRVRARYPGMPTLVITAFPAARPDEADVFHKPFDTSALLARVEELYRRAGQAS